MYLHQIERKQTIFESIGGKDPYFKQWEKEIHPILCEVAMNPAQIQQLFKSIEQGAGRTGLGKAVDVAKGAADKISDVWFNKFGGMLQSSGPVQAFDQKWEDIKSKVATKNPGLAAKLAKYGEFAKNNPKLHKFLLAIGGSAAAALGVALAGGVGAGALAVGTGAGVATGILNIADRLLQGQKASTAIGRGATTGAIAGLAAGAAAKIGELVRAGIKSDLIADLRGTKIMNHTMDYNGMPFSAVTKPPETQMLSQAFNNIDLSNPTNEQINAFLSILQKVNSPEYQQQISATREVARAAKEAAKSAMAVVKDLTNITATAAGGAASAATNQQPTPESLTRAQINELFGFTGNKVDASKLEKAWKAAGSPTDSDQIAQILRDAGVDDAVMQSAFQSLNISVSAAAGAAAGAGSNAGVGGTSGAAGKVADPNKLTVGQINKVIPTLKLRDLQSIQKVINANLAKRGLPTT